METDHIMQKTDDGCDNTDLDFLPCNIPDDLLDKLANEFYRLIPLLQHPLSNIKRVRQLTVCAPKLCNLVTNVQSYKVEMEQDGVTDDEEDDSEDFIRCFINYTMNIMGEFTGRKSGLLNYDPADISNILEDSRETVCHTKVTYDCREKLQGYFDFISGTVRE